MMQQHSRGICACASCPERGKALEGRHLCSDRVELISLERGCNRRKNAQKALPAAAVPNVAKSTAGLLLFEFPCDCEPPGVS